MNCVELLGLLPHEANHFDGFNPELILLEFLNDVPDVLLFHTIWLNYG